MTRTTKEARKAAWRIKMTKTAQKLAVWAPAVPGHDATIVGTADTMEQAREIASRYDHRRDLRMQDVTIRLASGKIVEKCGPCR